MQLGDEANVYMHLWIDFHMFYGLSETFGTVRWSCSSQEQDDGDTHQPNKMRRVFYHLSSLCQL